MNKLILWLLFLLVGNFSVCSESITQEHCNLVEQRSKRQEAANPNHNHKHVKRAACCCCACVCCCGTVIVTTSALAGVCVIVFMEALKNSGH